MSPNPHYKAGVRFEYKIMKLLKEHLPSLKYTILRTAGSHSPVDVVIIEHLGLQGVKRSFGIQCKTVKGKAKLNKYGLLKEYGDPNQMFTLVKSKSHGGL